MLRFAAVIACLSLSSATVAQSSPPVWTAAAPAAATIAVAPSSSVPKTRDGKPKSKELRAACKADAEAKGLKDDAGRAAWIACYRAGRPDLAKRFDCRTEARQKGTSGDALRAAIRNCTAA